MKKLSLIALSMLMLCACSSGGNEATTKKGEAQKTIENQGNEEIVKVEVTLDGDDKITAINFNETYNAQKDTKKDLGDDYGMKSASGIGKEWYEQVGDLENYVVENGLDAVVLDEEGYATGDVKAICTINLSNLIETAKEAVANAK